MRLRGLHRPCSAYWDGNGFATSSTPGAISRGLATLSVDRAFDNGIRIGAWQMLTDVSFDDFGEGSFDKGIRFEIPFRPCWDARSRDRCRGPSARCCGTAGKAERGRPPLRQRNYHQPGLQSQWGRF
ncbi:YjbH domain-containing protein [Salipiger sp.]|uniref:YjbH domain-containing protein n=1 Tax=Salipiger sp. TaxID=2078585 RepID=UPI003A97F8AC